MACKWRCTDVGSRTILAIRIDKVTVPGGRILGQAEAEAQGLFNGPPYVLAEYCFDEEDIEGCSAVDSSVDPSSSA